MFIIFIARIRTIMSIKMSMVIVATPFQPEEGEALRGEIVRRLAVDLASALPPAAEGPRSS